MTKVTRNWFQMSEYFDWGNYQDIVELNYRATRYWVQMFQKAWKQ